MQEYWKEVLYKMNGTEIITFLSTGIGNLSSAVGAVAGAIFTAIFLRSNTKTEEFEKIAEKHAQNYLSQLKDIDFYIKDFWDRNQHKIKHFYLCSRREDDVIISASIGFLLEELFSRIGVKNYLATEVDKTTGEVQKICYRKNKVWLFHSRFPGAEIENFYTDSKNDAAMMQIANRTYMVRGEDLELIDEASCKEFALNHIG